MLNFGQYPIWIIILLIVWVLPWKGYSLWVSARKGNKVWFIILLVLNTFAILEIIYVFFVAKINPSDMFSKKNLKKNKE